MTDGRKYSDAEVRAIIDRALANEAGTDGLNHVDLLAVGEQVGVSADAMTRAAHEVREAKLDGAAQQSLAARRRRWLAGHAGLFALINGLLFAVNYLTTPGEWWSLFPIFFWGLVVALHASFTFGAPLSKRSLAKERQRLLAQSPLSSQRVRIAQSAATAPQAEELASSDASPAAHVTKSAR